MGGVAHQQFQPTPFDVGALNAATARYFALSDMGPFVASGLGQGSGASLGDGGPSVCIFNVLLAFN